MFTLRKKDMTKLQILSQNQTLRFICYRGQWITAARSRQDSWASLAKKIRPLEKKLGRKPATPQIIRKSAVKNFCYKFLGQILPIIVKIRPCSTTGKPTRSFATERVSLDSV